MADPAVVALANTLAKMPWWAEFDAEAAFAAYKEKFAATSGTALTKDVFAQLFLALNYDKAPPAAAPAEGGAEGEEKKADEEGAAAPAAAPADAPKPTEYGAQVFDLLDAAKAGTVHVATALTTLLICKGGFGEPAFRFALKAVASDETNSLKEGPLHVAIRAAANRDFTPILRNHLRRAWRAAEKFAPPAPEAGAGGGEEGGDAPPAAPVVAPADSAVMVDDFVAKVTEDEALASALVKEVPVPIEAPPAAEPGADE